MTREIANLLNWAHIGAALVAGLGVLSGCASSGQASGGQSKSASGFLGFHASNDKSKIGSRILAEMNGGLIGGSIGADLGADDKRNALEAEYKALEYTPSGQPVEWKGASGRHGNVVAGQPYQVGSQNCRQYTETVFSGSASKSAKGAACRNPDGSWTPLT